jgi:hypothetical protein
MKALVVWCGPVSSFNLKGIDWPDGVDVAVVGKGQNGGIDSASFGLLAEKYRDASGRILPGLMQKVGYLISDYERVAIMGYSAAHGLMAQVLRDDADGPYVAAAVSIDACFSSATSIPKQGYVDFAARAARSESLFVLAGTAGDANGVTGWRCASVNAEKGAGAAGIPLGPANVRAPVPVPKSAEGAGSLLALDYSGIFSHAQVVPKLTAPIVNAYLLPYLAGAGPAPGSTSWSAGKTIAVVGAGTALAAGALYAWRRWG